MNDYNQDLCAEKHDQIDREFKALWKRMDKLEAKLWGVLVLLFMNLAVGLTVLAIQ